MILGSPPGNLQQSGEDPLLVRTNFGPVRGIRDDRGVRWLGIPFAAPPVGSKRWAAPEWPKPWTEPKSTTQHGKACPQLSNSAVWWFNFDQIDEDCLTLNIFAPSNWSSIRPKSDTVPSTRLKVMVWIYGGGFFSGGSSLYDPSRLAEETGSLVVTFNYRVDLMGYFLIPELISNSKPLNWGILDQQLALEWVQQNIHHFGGDPRNVLLFGESAGGCSVSLHMLMRRSWGKYSKVLLQSPGSFLWGTPQLTTTLGERIVELSPCANATDRLKCLREVPWRDLIDIQLANPLPFFAPVIDGVQIAATPARLFEMGVFNKDVPTMIGTTFQEGNFLASYFMATVLHVTVDITDPNPPVTKAQFDVMANLVRGMISDPSLSSAVISYYTSLAERTSWWRGVSDMFGDLFINCGEQTIADQVSRLSKFPTFRYLFTHIAVGGSSAGANATHGGDIPFFMFDTRLYCNPQTPCEFQPQDEEVARMSSEIIGEFHQKGRVDFWPPYHPDQINDVFDWDLPKKVITYSKNCAVWKDVLNTPQP